MTILLDVPDGAKDDTTDRIRSVVAAMNGYQGQGIQGNWTEYDDPDTFSQQARNYGGNHWAVFDSGADVTADSPIVKVTDGGLTVDGVGSSFGDVSISGTLGVGGAVTLSSTLAVSGATTLSSTLHTVGAATFDGAVTLGDAAADTITVNGTPTFLAATIFKHNVTIQNSVPTTLATFDVTAGAQKITLGAAATPNLYIDVQNLRTQVGVVTLPGNLPADRFDVVGGRTYLVANNEEQALGLRYGSGAVGNFFLGASNAATSDLTFKNDAGTQVARLLGGGGLIVGATTTMGSELLLVKGSGKFEGLITVTSGGLDITGTGTFQNNLTVNGNSTLGNAGTDTTTVNGTMTLNNDLVVSGATALDSNVDIGNSSGDTHIVNGNMAFNHGLNHLGTTLGFFGAGLQTKPTVTGSRGGNAALQDLLSELSNLGLITNSTTA